MTTLIRFPVGGYEPSGSTPPTHVDLTVRIPSNSSIELVALAGRSQVKPVAVNVFRVDDVLADRAFGWALDHLREAEVLSPAWLREWIADWLLLRAKEYYP